jgi:hypothetical protein
MNHSPRLRVITPLLAASNLSAATLQVSPGSMHPTPPGTNWATAATDVQQAVGVAAAVACVSMRNEFEIGYESAN